MERSRKLDTVSRKKAATAVFKSRRFRRFFFKAYVWYHCTVEKRHFWWRSHLHPVITKGNRINWTEWMEKNVQSAFIRNFHKGFFKCSVSAGSSMIKKNFRVQFVKKLVFVFYFCDIFLKSTWDLYCFSSFREFTWNIFYVRWIKKILSRTPTNIKYSQQSFSRNLFEILYLDKIFLFLLSTLFVWYMDSSLQYENIWLRIQIKLIWR